MVQGCASGSRGESLKREATMRLIQLTKQDDTLVWVNPDYVVEVRGMPATDGSVTLTSIVLADGSRELVKGEPAGVSQELEAQGS